MYKRQQKLVASAQKKLDALEKEKQRIENLKKYEKEYAGYTYICGIDEVGRGPLAGPVVAGAVILPKDCNILYINDSKQLSEKKREELYDVITKEAVDVYKRQILLYFRFSIRQIHTILNVSSDYPERRYRSWRMAAFTSTARNWRSPTEEKRCV